MCLEFQTGRHGPRKAHALESGSSETLQVVPVQKRFRVVAAAKGTWTDVAGSAINLHLEGNWMPLRVRLVLQNIAVLPCKALAARRWNHAKFSRSYKQPVARKASRLSN